jgi:hypothetical protein
MSAEDHRRTAAAASALAVGGVEQSHWSIYRSPIRHHNDDVYTSNCIVAAMAGFFSCTTLLVVLVAVYVGLVAQQVYFLMHPLHGVEIAEPAVKPLWAMNETYDLHCFVSRHSNPFSSSSSM